MAVYVILFLVAGLGVAAFVLYRRGYLGDTQTRSGSTGRLHQRVQDARGQGAAPTADDFVDSRAAVWDTPDGAAPEADDLFADEVPVVEPVPAARDAFFDDLPYAEDSDEDDGSDDDADEVGEIENDEPTATMEPLVAAVDRPAPSPLVVDDDEADRFTPRSSYVPGLVEDEEGDAADELEELDEPAAVAADGTEPLARRTPKASEEAYRRPLRLAQTTQRASGASRRSPEQVRNMLANYRTGLSKGRSEPTDDE